MPYGQIEGAHSSVARRSAAESPIRVIADTSAAEGKACDHCEHDANASIHLIPSAPCSQCTQVAEALGHSVRCCLAIDQCNGVIATDLCLNIRTSTISDPLLDFPTCIFCWCSCIVYTMS